MLPLTTPRKCLILCILYMLILPIFFPTANVVVFSSYIVLCFYHFSKDKGLFLSLGCGVLNDLASGSGGVFLLLYPLATLVAYKAHLIFAKESKIALLIVNMIFCFTFLILTIPAYALFGHQIHWSIDFLISPLRCSFLDNLIFSSLIYILPCAINSGIRKLVSFIRRLVCC
ncbi:hypothetical protein C10C_0304 [Chlamydia serpentis]|uniref:Rod shape-determining protein MreD n=1 Tax=Chlamydia serpentis TaxID=1967782 RepID=A0A2R8FB57_9CHLA|nr:hypothetical protein [Chlamydia serpentis]SPN73477.1 hypothetical protein C10C_0304 [Chlamydia serpentis]